MRRNWDVIREVLCEVEALNKSRNETLEYSFTEKEGLSVEKVEQAILLFNAGFIEADDISTLNAIGIEASALTWAGYDLLDTIRSQPLWERIKRTAKDKGIELTFDAVKVLGKQALETVF